MAVEPEFLSAPPHDLRVVSVMALRGLDGRWTVHIVLRGEVVIDGDRKVCLDREVRLSEVQKGSRPRGGRSYKNPRRKKVRP